MAYRDSTAADWYVYPGTTVLQNKLNIREQKLLESAERDLTWVRRQELEESPVNGQFDLAHLQEIHRRLFQDLYDWAGHIRNVQLSRGSSTFYASSDFGPGAEFTFGYLHDGPLLDHMPISDGSFIKNAAEFLSRVNYLHPFREGNGRAQRAFLDQVAAQSGRKLSWRNISATENTRASIRAYNAGSGKPFEDLIAQIIAPPLDGLDPFTDNIYQVNGLLN